MIRLISRYKWHFLFWIAYFIFWVFFSVYQYGNTYGKALLYTTAWFIGQAGSAYLTVYWLMPRYFNRRRYILFSLFYLLILAGSAGLILGCMLGIHQLLRQPLPVPVRTEFVFL